MRITQNIGGGGEIASSPLPNGGRRASTSAIPRIRPMENDRGGADAQSNAFLRAESVSSGEGSLLRGSGGVSPLAALRRSTSEPNSLVSDAPLEAQHVRGFTNMKAKVEMLRRDNKRQKLILDSFTADIEHEEYNVERLRDGNNKLKGENNKLKGKVAALKAALHKTPLARWLDKHPKCGTFFASAGGLLSLAVGAIGVETAVTSIAALAVGATAVSAGTLLLPILAVGAAVLAIGLGAFCALKIRDYRHLQQAKRDASQAARNEQPAPAA
ncbi:MAG: hypothetical protein C5B47_00855 [Verrucomicrobia bacterium]|nr:MAG: hypothetical protein C5B47_00855 [Verrucomicrobiota bacterium]